jgi:uncharacterized alkaline shock family protein YloU
MSTELQNEGERLTVHESVEGIRGKVTLTEDVVATIAGLAAREIKGIHSLGKSRFIAFGDAPKRGVTAEVGTKQVAFDLDVVIDYGCDIRSVANEMRRRVAAEVGRMAGREVVEININVVGIDLPGKEVKKAVETPPRVL